MNPSPGPYGLTLDPSSLEHVIFDLNGRQIARVRLMGETHELVKISDANARLFKSSAEMLEILLEISDDKKISAAAIQKINRILKFVLHSDKD